MKLLEFFVEDQADWEIKNLDKLDRILTKLAEMVIQGQDKDPDYYGMVAAAVLDPDNNIVARLNFPGKDGRRIHAERAAMMAYTKKYGEIPEGSIIITTLSPCSDHMDDRVGESCTDLINKSPVHKVYCGYMDPTQHEHDTRQFTLQETNSENLRKACKALADTFLNDEIDENFADDKQPKQKDYFRGSKFGDEEGNTWSVESVLDFAKSNPVYFKKDFPLSKLQHDLDWWEDNPEQRKRMANADTNYPLLVLQNDGGHLTVADGLNRMKKAISLENRKTIDVYLVPKKDIMDLADIGMGQASHEKNGISESINVTDFKEILKKFLPFAKKIVNLDNMPTIVLKKTLSTGDQPTMGRFHNDSYTLELAIANRQPVDILRTLAHELVHAKQHEQHVDIDPTTGSPEENEANAVAGIVMRHFNKEYPEYLSFQPLEESKSNGRKRIF
jgi:pyrimidine deaminase RibD-like protein